MPSGPIRSDRLLRAPVGRTLRDLAAPMVLGIAAIILFNVVDTFYVGRLGTRPLAAMGFTFPVVYLVLSVAMGMSVGVTSVIARAIGEGDPQRVRRLTTDGLILAWLLVVLVALVGFLTMDPAFRLLGAGPELLPLIRSYMTPWYLGVGFLVVPMVGNAAIRATGDTRTPSFVMLLAGLVNVVLDPLLIFGPGPFPRLELQGAALATVISWTTTLGAALWILGRRDRMFIRGRPPRREMLASWRAILGVAAPAAATNMMIPLANGIFTRIVAGGGAATVAAFGVGQRLESLSMVGMAGLAAGVAPFVGQNYGAGHLDRLRTAVTWCLRAALFYGLAVASALAILATLLARLFNDDPQVVAVTTDYLRILPWSYAGYGAVLVTTSMLHAMNHPLRASVLIVLRLFVLAVPLAWLGFGWAGPRGLFLGIATGNLAAALVAAVVIRRFLK